jgi:DDE superfamily endonuclease/Tc5 transposase DNA-binding domain
MELGVFEWIAANRAVNIPVTGALIKEKALQVAQLLVEKYEDADADVKNKLHIDALRDFKASWNWYNNFLRRFKLKSGKLSGELLVIYLESSSSFRFAGEAASVDLAVVEQSQKDFQAILLEYNADDIYNLDEFGLFWKLLPDRSFIFSPPFLSSFLPFFHLTVRTVMLSVEERGVKRPKSRVTGVLITNLSGTDKRTPILIGQAKIPQCWKKRHLKSLPVKYLNSKKAWMNGKLFQDTLLDLNKEMKKQNRNIVLLVDGAGTLSD